ncbi:MULTISPECIES: transposase [unclassified Streptomyces]|uniref:IS110 family transposase n=1 Tax=unclassified Streptomyces TaxID=2593676 RepID=UPI003811F049
MAAARAGVFVERAVAGAWRTGRARVAMRRIADLCSGEAKTDVPDAVIIADAARAMPRTLR